MSTAKERVELAMGPMLLIQRTVRAMLPPFLFSTDIYVDIDEDTDGYRVRLVPTGGTAPYARFVVSGDPK